MAEAFHLDLLVAALGQAVVILEEVAVILEEVVVILVPTGSKDLAEVISLADRAQLAAVGQTDLVVVAPTITGPVLVAVV